MLARETARVVATPQDQVVGLGDNSQFFVFPYLGLRYSSQQQAEDKGLSERQAAIFNFDRLWR
jgi:hypothetical protein